MADLRFEQKQVSESFNFKDLHYMSAHSLGTTTDCFVYGKQRLHLYLTESWVDKKFEYGGLGFKDTNVLLTSEELDKIPLGKAQVSLDSIPFETIIRNGLRFKIHDDERKFWESQSSSHSDTFKKLNEGFEKDYAGLLTKTIESGFGVVAPPQRVDNGSEAVVAVDESKSDPSAQPEEHESFDALNNIDKIVDRKASEINDVELLLGTSGHTYGITKKNKSVGKSQLVGGFSSGKYVPLDSQCPGVELSWSDGDQTLVQVDQSGIKPENLNMETMTLYKYCVTLEASKKVTNHKFSYSKIERKKGADDTDGFEVEISTPSKYISQNAAKDDPIQAFQGL